EVEELLELGELDHRAEAPLGLAPGQPHQDSVQHAVLTSGQLGVEADAELDERRDPSGHPYAAGVGAVDARHDLQQAAFARAVAPDDPEELTLVDVERDVAQRVQLTVLDPAQRMDSALLQRVDAVLGDPEGLVDAAGFDHHRPARALSLLLRARRRGESVTDGWASLGHLHSSAMQRRRSP